MGTPFIGEIKMISWNYPPQGWAFCNGQLLQINQNQAMYALLGTTFGGDGRTTFGLPDFRGRASVHQGAGYTMGEHGGEEAHTLTQQEMPAHTHALNASTLDGDTLTPNNSVLARTVNNIYALPAAFTPTQAATVKANGGSQAHQNMQPYLCINFVIALVGIFPSRN